VDWATVYFAGPETLPLTFFADDRGLSTRLAELDRGDFGDLDLPRCCVRWFCPFDRLWGDLDLFCRRDFCFRCFERLCLPGLSEKETFLWRTPPAGCSCVRWISWRIISRIDYCSSGTKGSFISISRPLLSLRVISACRDLEAQATALSEDTLTTNAELSLSRDYPPGWRWLPLL